VELNKDVDYKKKEGKKTHFIAIHAYCAKWNIDINAGFP